MTLSCEAWLPPTALFDGVLGDRAFGWTRQWEKRWFRSPKAVSMRVSARGDAPAARTTAWGTRGDGLVLSIEDETVLRLACELLGIRRRPRRMSNTDMRLLRAVSEACLRDLLAHIASGFGLAEELSAIDVGDLKAHARSAAMRFTVSINGLPRGFDIYLSQNAAVAGRKAQIAPPREPHPLGTRRSAAEAQEIAVGACIGWSQVALGELRSLEPDDVVVLDGAFGTDLELLINGRRTVDPGVELARSGSALVLRERKISVRAA
jgi:flagellar motor switch/type III secretory pathway protein FliN